MNEFDLKNVSSVTFVEQKQLISKLDSLALSSNWQINKIQNPVFVKVTRFLCAKWKKYLEINLELSLQYPWNISET